MPLYDYKCKKCEYLFEVEQRMSDPKLEFCPKCKGKVERLISPVGIIFKGSGFYVTDNKKSQAVAPATPKGSTKPGEPKKESPQPANPETKPTKQTEEKK